MAKTKARDEIRDRPSASTDIERRPEPAEREPRSGPQPAAPIRTAAPPLPPSNGEPAPARAAGVLGFEDQGGAGRARLMTGMQRAVGNTRAGRMLAEAPILPPPASQEREQEAPEGAQAYSLGFQPQVGESSKPPSPEGAAATAGDAAPAAAAPAVEPEATAEEGTEAPPPPQPLSEPAPEALADGAALPEAADKQALEGSAKETSVSAADIAAELSSNELSGDPSEPSSESAQENGPVEAEVVLPEPVTTEPTAEPEPTTAQAPAEEIQLPSEAAGLEAPTQAAAEEEATLEAAIPEGAQGETTEAAVEAEGTAEGGAAATEATGATAGPAAERDSARTERGQAGARVMATSAQLASLGATPVSFAPRAEESSRQAGTARGGRERRSAVEALAGQFLARNAGIVQNLLAYGEIAPPRILAVAGAAQSGIQEAIDRNRAMVLEAIAAERGRVQAAAEDAKATILEQHQLTIDSLGANWSAARDSLRTAHDEAAALLDPLATEQQTTIEGIYDRYAGRFREVGTEVGNEAVAIGRRRSQAYLDQRNGESDLLDGPLHDNRLEASSDAANQVAEAFREQIVAAGEQQATLLAETRAADLANIGSALERSREILQSQLDQALTAFDDAETQSVAGADSTRDQLLSTIDGNCDATFSQLDQMEAIQVARLDEYGQRQSLALEADAEQAIASVLEGVAQAATTLQSALQGFVESARATEAPEESALQALLADAQMKVDAMAAGLAQQTEEGIAASEQGVAAGAEQSVQALDELGASGVDEVLAVGYNFTDALAEMDASASASFAEMRDTVLASASEMVTSAREGFLAVSDELRASFADTGVQLEERFDTLANDLRKSLRHEGLADIEAQITQHADEAAAQVQPRWKSVLKVLLVVVVVIAVALVTAGAGFGLLGTLALGTALGAASGAVIQIGNNLIDGKKTFDGVLKAAAVGAIGGLFGGLGAAAGAAVANVGLKIGLELGLDALGGVLGDLAVGNPITAEGILLGAAIGLGAAGAPAALAGLKNLGGRIRTGLRGRLGGLQPRVGAAAGAAPTPPRVQPSAKPDVPSGPHPPTAGAPPSPRRPAAPEPEVPPRPRGDAEPAPSTPDEAGRRVARETMEEAGEDAATAARRAGADTPEGAPSRRHPDEPDEAGQRQGREAAEEATEDAAARAAEEPVAMAAARHIAEVNDALNTPVAAVVALLTALKQRFRWIRRFVAEPKQGIGRYTIWLIASKIKVDDYHEENLDESQGEGPSLSPEPTRITPGSLPVDEERAVLQTLQHIDTGMTPTGPLAKKWGTPFKNNAGDLPGTPGAGGYLEYRVAPPAGTSSAGVRRIVKDVSTGRLYYTWTHYGDTGHPAFVRLR
jgi:hypothetical protein